MTITPQDLTPAQQIELGRIRRLRKFAQTAAGEIRNNKEGAETRALTEALGLSPDNMLAGNRMRVEYTTDDTISVTFDDKGTGRVCGGCTLCCKLLPVPTIDKAGFTRCEHQRHSKGCAIHDRSSFPMACRTYACRWLADPSTKGLPRPDRAHYVLDLMPDQARMTNTETGEVGYYGVYQIWVDPAFPDAWRTPELKAWMLAITRAEGRPFVVRYGPDCAISVFPPPTDDHPWAERDGGELMPRDEWNALKAREAAHG